MTRKILKLLPLIISVVYFASVVKIPKGTLEDPGPGIYPIILGIVAICLSLFVLLTDLKARSHSEDSEESGEKKGYVFTLISCVVLILLMMFLFEYLGALLTLFLLILFLLKIFGVPGWIKVLSISFCFSFVIFVLFNYVMKLMLPQGVLGALF